MHMYMYIYIYIDTYIYIYIYTYTYILHTKDLVHPQACRAGDPRPDCSGVHKGRFSKGGFSN